MPYKVAIRKNETGEIRFHEVEWDWFKGDPEDGDWSWWVVGNFSCDCNRRDSWITDADPDAEEESTCSDGKFSALYAELPDGTRITLDEVSPAAPSRLISQFLWLGDTPPKGAPA